MRLFLSIAVAFTYGLGASALPQGDSHIVREGQYWVRSISGAIKLSPDTRLRVETVGAVILHGDNSDRVAYTFKARAKANDPSTAEAMLRRFHVNIGTQSGGAYVIVQGARAISEDSELSVSAPRGLRQASVVTRGGSVQAAGLEGELDARSAGGPITVDEIRGSAEIQTGGGNIQVGSVGGALRCFSGGGTIRVQNAGGESWIETVGGEIFVHQAMAPVHVAAGGGNIRIDHASGSVFARAAGGLIQVQQADGAVTAESSGGAIQVNAASGVECDSTGGAIRLRNVAGVVRASTNAGNILAELVPDHRMQDSTLSTRAGDITVLIPSNVPVTVMARNASGGNAGRIVSEFPEIRVSADTESGGMPLIAEGSLDGGGPILHINVAGGTIYLRRKQQRAAMDLR